MIDFKPVAIKGRLGLGQPMPSAPSGTPGTVPTVPGAAPSSIGKKTLPLILLGIPAVLSGLIAYGHRNTKTEGEDKVFVMAITASLLSTAGFLYTLFAQRDL